jgi:hypothetical protein
MQRLLVSVVIENQTAILSSEPRVAENVREACRQVAELPAPGGEVLMVSSTSVEDLPEGVRCVVLPGKAYYGLKNAGMREARGGIVIFTDADCRMGPGYVERVLEVFREDAGLACVAGRSYYDGTGFLATLNTALSFGYLHNPEARDTEPYGVLAHNVAVRASVAAAAPFGPFAGRVGGDRWLTDWYKAKGTTVRLERRMVIYHEDPSYSLKLRMDRQLRELLCSVEGTGALWPWRAGTWVALGKAVLSPAWRLRKLLRYGRHVGMGPLDIVMSLPVLGLYALADVTGVLTMMVAPGLGRRWLRYQNAV